MEDHRTTTKPDIEISLALGGGAARGAFHLGFISSLQKNGVKIKAVSGCSAGSLAAATLVSGIDPKEALEIFKSKEFKKIFKWSWFKKSLFKIDYNDKIFNSIYPKTDLSESEIPFFVCVADMNSFECLHLDKGDAKKIIKASCALVPMFEPVSYDGMTLADGGILDILPTTPLKNLPYPILGLNVMPTAMPKKQTFFSLTKRVWQMLWMSRLPKDIANCRWYIAPKEISSMKIFGFRDIDKAFDLGFEKGEIWYNKL